MSIQLTNKVEALEKRMNDLEEAFEAILSFVHFKFEDKEEVINVEMPKKGKGNGKNQ